MTRRKSRTEERREAWGLVPSYEEIETGEEEPRKSPWGKRTILTEPDEEGDLEPTEKESFFDHGKGR